MCCTCDDRSLLSSVTLHYLFTRAVQGVHRRTQTHTRAQAIVCAHSTGATIKIAKSNPFTSCINSTWEGQIRWRKHPITQPRVSVQPLDNNVVHTLMSRDQSVVRAIKTSIYGQNFVNCERPSLASQCHSHKKVSIAHVENRDKYSHAPSILSLIKKSCFNLLPIISFPGMVHL